MVSDLAAFNPYSLLHIPLYGILTVLLIFSFIPMKLNRVNTFSRLCFNFKSNIPNILNDPSELYDPNDLSGPNELNGQNGLNDPNDLNDPNSSTHKRNHTSTYARFFIPGVTSLIVAIADEIHQSFIPTRDASITDVFLDTVGILLSVYLISRLYKIKKWAFSF
jgi:hypothetical protein